MRCRANPNPNPNPNLRPNPNPSPNPNPGALPGKRELRPATIRRLVRTHWPPAPRSTGDAHEGVRTVLELLQCCCVDLDDGAEEAPPHPSVPAAASTSASAAAQPTHTQPTTQVPVFGPAAP